jgi:hypothetical protein
MTRKPKDGRGLQSVNEAAGPKRKGRDCGTFGWARIRAIVKSSTQRWEPRATFLWAVAREHRRTRSPSTCTFADTGLQLKRRGQLTFATLARAQRVNKPAALMTRLATLQGTDSSARGNRATKSSVMSTIISVWSKLTAFEGNPGYFAVIDYIRDEQSMAFRIL